MSGYPQPDATTIGNWVFPQSDTHPIRNYQLNICKHALFMNTLVCLPTGLGKTLIAAVVMYNYYRWFPTGKVIFLAPTKPLVTQQINACHGIMGIPEEDIAHLEGTVAAAKRETFWKAKRVFFCTPQTFSNDLSSGRCDPRDIVCLVVDEAHRATGQYAYTTLVQEIVQISKRFRVLALSATPGSDAKRIQMVIKNLLISHIEMRSEDDPELLPYTHQRQIDIITCEQGAYSGIQAVRRYLNTLLEVPLNKLRCYGLLLCHSAQDLNILFLKDAEMALETAWKDHVYTPEVLSELKVSLEDLTALLRCRKALCDEGIKAVLELFHSMHSYYMERLQRGEIILTSHSIVSTEQFKHTVEILNRAQNDHKYLEIRQPKLNKLKEIILEHFQRHKKVNSSTKVLIFSHLRSTVHEIKTEISDLTGIKAHEFVGQGTAKSTSSCSDADPNYSNKGFNQVEQARILRDFNQNKYNVLIATSIAEEGLDIAEVDLIILFEAVISPIRFIQRCGRTGRQRSGKIIMLVSKGTEEEKVEKSHETASNVTKILTHASKSMHFYSENPNMLPTMEQPTMTLCNMKINLFRPGSIAGGIGQISKSNSVASMRSNTSGNDSSGTSNSLSSKYNHTLNSFLYSSATTGTSVATKNMTLGKQRSVRNSFLPPPSGEEEDEGDDWIFAEQQQQRDQTTSTAAAAYDERSDGHGWMESRRMTAKDTTHIAARDAASEDVDLFGWGLCDASAAPFGSRNTTTAQSSQNTSSESRLHTEAGGNCTNKTGSRMWSALSTRKAEVVDLIDLVDSPPLNRKPTAASCLLHHAAAKSKAVAANIEHVPSQILAPLAAPSTSDGSFPLELSLSTTAKPFASSLGYSRASQTSTGSSFADIRLKNTVRSTTRTVNFFCDSSVSLGGNASDATIEDSDQEGTTDRVVTILDSDLKPRHPGGRVGRIQQTQTMESPQIQQLEDRLVDVSPILLQRCEQQVDPDEDSGTVCSSSSSVGRHCTQGSDTTSVGEDDDWQDTANACCACLSWESDEDDPIIFCDGLCGACIHLSCYGLLRNGVPEGEFYCESCEALRTATGHKPVCKLCFQAGGLMKRSTSQEWTHPVCVLFTPELTFCLQTNRPDNIRNLLSDRKGLTCELCHRSGGACVQCSSKECLRAYHPYCAYTARQQMIVRVKTTTTTTAAADSAMHPAEVVEDDTSVSYELFCPKHKQQPILTPHGEVASSRIPIQSSQLHSKNKQETYHKQVASLGIADMNSPIYSNQNQFHDDDLIDTEEKPSKQLKLQKSHLNQKYSPNRKRLRKVHNKKNIAQLKLVPKSTHSRRKKDKKSRANASKFFELEAAVSGSDSSDGSEGEGVSEEESCISGGFINDGAYTQHESPGGVATQYGMYLAVNNYHMHMQSPEDLVRGRPNVAALVCRRARFNTSPGSATADNADSSVLSSDVSILQDTPEREREGPSGRSKAAIHKQQSLPSKHGGKRKNIQEGSADNQSAEEEAEFDYDLPSKPRKAPQSLAIQSSASSAIGTGKENVGAKKSAPFWQKFRSNGNGKSSTSKFIINSSSDDSDDGSDSKRKKPKHSIEASRNNSSAVASSSSVSIGKGLDAGNGGVSDRILQSRPPLAPAQHINFSAHLQQDYVRPNKARALASAAEEESLLFDWGF